MRLSGEAEEILRAFSPSIRSHCRRLALSDSDCGRSSLVCGYTLNDCGQSLQGCGYIAVVTLHQRAVLAWKRVNLFKQAILGVRGCDDELSRLSLPGSTRPRTRSQLIINGFHPQAKRLPVRMHPYLVLRIWARILGM